MRLRTLLQRSLVHYWRINLAVVGGVAVAVAVLAGALTVGASVRASLRAIALERLGQVDHAIVGSGFFRDELASAFPRAAPLIAMEGFVTDQDSGGRASRVQVYAVDERFWSLQGVAVDELGSSQAMLSEALAAELTTQPGRSIVLRVEQASAIPTESLHGRRDNVGRSVRLDVGQILRRDQLGEFSLSPRQGAVRAVFVPLARMRQLLEQPGRANAIVIAGAGANVAATEQTLKAASALEDFGLTVRVLESQQVLALESRRTMLSERLAEVSMRVADKLGLVVVPTLTYLANSIQSGNRAIPYSVITALDLGVVGLAGPEVRSLDPGAILLNEWAAKDLGASPGDRVSIDYYVWEPEGRLSTRQAQFTVARVLAMSGIAADPDLVPEYPGITDSKRLADWDPPFPIDLNKVRPIDEEYWERYRATPKAFIPIERGQTLWSSRHGGLTALRLIPPKGATLDEARTRYVESLRMELNPATFGFSVYDVRTQSINASAGSTDFGEYFTYFSTFLVVSALLLAGLFFKLGVEHRVQEIGLLQAVGVHPAAIRRLFVSEAVVLSLVGAVAGVAGAIGYAWLIMLGLRTWWVDAVGTTALALRVDPVALGVGAAAVVVIAVAAIWWSLRSIAGVSTRSLVMGRIEPDVLFSRRPVRKLDTAIAAACGLAAVILIVATATGAANRVAGFFGAGALAMLAMLLAARVWLRSGTRGVLRGHGNSAVWRLGMRSARYRPGRSVLCIALIAFATFVIVSVEAFKHDDAGAAVDRRSGGGGYPLVLETLLPIVHDPGDEAGRDALNLPQDLPGVRFDRFRVRPGDDASCLNLYQPRNPRVLGASAEFVGAARFAFQSSLAETPEERANPWLLLHREFPDGAIPVIADANSLAYVLHLGLGDDLVLPGSSDRPIRLRVVAALAQSIFQGELLMAEAPFMRVFPEWEGYRFFLIDAPLRQTGEMLALLESRLADFGADAATTSDRLAGFRRVEYTYLSTFQMLGGLGLLLGTIGLGAVLLRNVLERRRELAVLRAVGYRQADFFTMVMAENVLLLVGGLFVGTSCALLAIAPMFLDRGSQLPGLSLAVLLVGVLLTGLLVSLGSTVIALRAPLLRALRGE